MAPKPGSGVVAHPPTKKLGKGELPPIPPGLARVTVTVLLAPGMDPETPIPDVSIEITGQFGDVRKGTQKTNKDGEVTTHAFPPGTFQFLALKPGFGPVPASNLDAFAPDTIVVQTATLIPGPNSVFIRMSDGTGAVEVEVVKPDIKTAIADCDVEDTGSKKTGKTDARGKVILRALPAGKRDIKGRKVGFGPNKTPFQFGAAPPEAEVVVAAGRTTLARVILTAESQSVVRIMARIPATKTRRASALSPVNPDNVLTQSTTDAEDLGTNKPVILIRGCTKVELEVEMNPLGKVADWIVKPNENTNSAPTITILEGGKKAELSTDKTGSFSVIAASGDSRKVWNVVFVFVDVKVDTTVIVKRNTGYLDGTEPGIPSTADKTRFRSGEFIFGRQAFECTVEVELTGGGKSGDLGITPITVLAQRFNYLQVGKVNVHFLQNGIADTVQGVYPGTPDGIGSETTSAPLPILDNHGAGGAPPNTTQVPSSVDGAAAQTLGGRGSPFPTTPDLFLISRVSARRVRLKFGDSPTGFFARRHRDRTKARLSKIQGKFEFHTAVVSASQDALNAVVVHAELKWEAVYDGNVTYSGDVGTYVRTTAHTAAPLKYTLVSPETGGKDAKDADFEMFEPRFNKGSGTIFTP
jgi:hypothetical protein